MSVDRPGGIDILRLPADQIDYFCRNTKVYGACIGLWLFASVCVVTHGRGDQTTPY